MNRWLLIWILGLGTSLLVTHAVIPHHHHDGGLCYHQDEPEDHGQEASHHHGPENPFDDNCILKQLYLPPLGKRVTINPVQRVTEGSFSFAKLPAQSDAISGPDIYPLTLLSPFSLPWDSNPGLLFPGLRAPPLA
ncbi:MAG: DUF6769 family protein [Bacteroidota bacterium]